MNGFRRVLATVAIVELWVAVSAFIFVLLLTMVQVGYRYLFAGSIWWAQEVSQLGMLIAYFLGIAYVYKARQDIIVGFLVQRLPRRMQASLAMAVQLVVAAFCILLVVTGIELAPTQLVFFTYILNIPRFYSTLPLIAASVSMALTAAYYAIVAWRSRDMSATDAAAFVERSQVAVAPEVSI